MCCVLYVWVVQCIYVCICYRDPCCSVFIVFAIVETTIIAFGKCCYNRLQLLNRDRLEYELMDFEANFISKVSHLGNNC